MSFHRCSAVQYAFVLQCPVWSTVGLGLQGLCHAAALWPLLLQVIIRGQHVQPLEAHMSEDRDVSTLLHVDPAKAATMQSAVILNLEAVQLRELVSRPFRLQRWAEFVGLPIIPDLYDRYYDLEVCVCGCVSFEVVWNDDWRALDIVCRQSCQRAECVCVCPPGDGWFLQVTNSRIVLMVQGNSGVGTDGAGRGKGLPGAQALA